MPDLFELLKNLDEALSQVERADHSTLRLIVDAALSLIEENRVLRTFTFAVREAGEHYASEFSGCGALVPIFQKLTEAAQAALDGEEVQCYEPEEIRAHQD